jgi:2-polyprenyl-6-methoxyphenol hydroxylase-like FAD-dependent oxidoreductase
MKLYDGGEVPVLFSGGGLVGLSTAMFLAQHGISSLAIERLKQGSQLPRAAFFHMRTLELFRSAGIEDDVRTLCRLIHFHFLVDLVNYPQVTCELQLIIGQLFTGCAHGTTSRLRARR